MSGSDQAALLVFSLFLLLQVSFIEPAVIYCTLVFLLAPAIRHRGSDRLNLEVRTFYRRSHSRRESDSNRKLLSAFGFCGETKHQRAWSFFLSSQ